MTRGFYHLTSGMLSQTRRLDVVSNNMTNVTTAGFKSEQYLDIPFNEVMLSRVGSTDKDNPQPVGPVHSMLVPDELYVNYAQGGMEETGMMLDFAIEGDGFFAIQTDDGVEYTRGGSFSMDNEGYLSLPGHGRVLDVAGQPIYLPTDNLEADNAGRISTKGGGFVGQIGVYAFPDNQELEKADSGLFGANGQQAELVQAQTVKWKWLEASNVDMLQEMADMMTAQRALQSVSQVLKLYDQLLTKTTTEVGRL